MNPDYEKHDIPRLSEEVKSLNGKSSRKLAESIKQLDLVLDEKEKMLDDEHTEEIIKHRKIL